MFDPLVTTLYVLAGTLASIGIVCIGVLFYRRQR